MLRKLYKQMRRIFLFFYHFVDVIKLIFRVGHFPNERVKEIEYGKQQLECRLHTVNVMPPAMPKQLVCLVKQKKCENDSHGMLHVNKQSMENFVMATNDGRKHNISFLIETGIK